jgi:uncharacterized membrane protein
MSADRGEVREPTWGTERLEAFSDGVFAIAITLLVLDIKVPAIPNVTGDNVDNALFAALVNQWPKYLAYVLSFLTVLIMWAGHHSLVSYVKKTNWNFFLLNGLYLMGVAVLPFPTALLSEYIGHPGGRVAVAVYSATFLGISLVFNGLFWYAAGNSLLKPEADPQELRHMQRRNLVGPVFYVLALVLALADLVWASLAIYAFLAVFYLVPRALVRRWLGD